ncbi:hypothetical protein ACFL3F_03020 [Planctomycetota bacterium]
MDDRGKLYAKLGLLGVSLIAAVFLWRNFIVSRGAGGIDDVAPGQMILTLCVNSDCKDQSEMDKRSYFQEVETLLRENPQWGQALLLCSKCGKNSVVRAEQCPKCNYIFRYGGLQHEAADCCPKCRYSQTKEDRKKGV